MPDSELLFLLEKLEGIANEDFDGHLTIMKFTTGWKAMFGTPNLDIDGRAEAAKLKSHKTLKDALDSLLNDYWTGKMKK